MIMNKIRENFAFSMFAATLVLSVCYLTISIYFNKNVKYRAFEECLTTITSEYTWNTRKGTVKYCADETLK